MNIIKELREQKQRNRNSVDKNEGHYRCSNCFTTGVNPIDLLIYETCFVCAGHGHVDWIDNAMDNRRKDVNKKTVEICRMNNIIQTLIFLKRELRKSKISISLEFKCKNENSAEIATKLMELVREHEII